MLVNVVKYIGGEYFRMWKHILRQGITTVSKVVTRIDLSVEPTKVLNSNTCMMCAFHVYI